jgi:hypothetical protein
MNTQYTVTIQFEHASRVARTVERELEYLHNKFPETFFADHNMFGVRMTATPTVSPVTASLNTLAECLSTHLGSDQYDVHVSLNDSGWAGAPEGSVIEVTRRDHQSDGDPFVLISLTDDLNAYHMSIIEWLTGATPEGCQQPTDGPLVDGMNFQLPFMGGIALSQIQWMSHQILCALEYAYNDGYFPKDPMPHPEA